jgi:hypothetical protein
MLLLNTCSAQAFDLERFRLASHQLAISQVASFNLRPAFARFVVASLF